MLSFEWNSPTKIIFGHDKINNIAAYVKNFGNNVLIIYGSSSATQSGALAKVTSLLQAANLNYLAFAVQVANAATITAAINYAKDTVIDVVIGLGGGRALDVAKIVALGLKNQELQIYTLIGTTLAEHLQSMPTILLPTTAGSGSEVTKAAIILDEIRNFKSGIRGDQLYPNIAIVDPEISATMPLRVARESAFDALAHAVETYIAKKSQPISEALSLQALELLSRVIPGLIANRSSSRLNDAAALAALVGGINVANCGTCLPHRFEQAMAAMYKHPVSHGQGLAIMYPAWLRCVEPFAREKLQTISNIFNYDNIFVMFASILNGLEMDKSLDSIGFTKSDINLILANISGALENDPIQDMSHGLLKNILQESYKESVNAV